MLEIGKTYRIKDELVTSDGYLRLVLVTKSNGIYIYEAEIGFKLTTFRCVPFETAELTTNATSICGWAAKAWDSAFVKPAISFLVSDASLVLDRGEPTDADEHQGQIWNPYADGGKGAWRFL